MALSSRNTSTTSTDSRAVEKLSEYVKSQWRALSQYLPDNLDEMARQHKAMAFQSHSRIDSASTLVHLVCLWAIGSFSLKTCAAFAEATGLGSISAVAWRKRFMRMRSFLESLLDHLISSVEDTSKARAELFARWQVIAVDGTHVPVGTNSIRMHWALDLANNKIHQLLFDPDRPNWGETFRNFSPGNAQLWIADRIYCTAVGLQHLVERGAEAIVRYNRNLTIFDGPEKNKVLDPLELAASVVNGAVRDLSVWVGTKNGTVIPARLVITRLSKSARKRQIAQLVSSKIKVTGYSRKLAGYLLVLTTVDKQQMTGEQVLSLYRLRWQIELRFKRAKSLMGLVENRCKTAETAVVWLLAHLVGQLLLDHAQRDALGESNDSYRQSVYYIDQVSWELLRASLFSVRLQDLGLFLQRFAAALRLPKSLKKQRTYDRLAHICQSRAGPLWTAAV